MDPLVTHALSTPLPAGLGRHGRGAGPGGLERRATRVRAQGGTLQLHDLERPLLRRAARRGRGRHRHPAQHQRAGRQRRGLHARPGGRRTARHHLRRRALGAEVLRGRPHRRLGHQRARGRQDALHDRPRVPMVDRARRALPRLSRSAGRRSRSTTTPRTSHRRRTRGRCCSTRSTSGASSSRTSPRRSRAYMGKYTGAVDPYNHDAPRSWPAPRRP